MSSSFSDWCEPARRVARERAGRFLFNQGFVESGSGWAGRIALESDATLEVHVDLPREFPDALPQISIKPDQVHARAHVEADRRICLAPASGTLLDHSRPEKLVADALARARSILVQPEAEQRLEVESEFAAYWRSHDLPILSTAAHSRAEKLSLGSIDGDGGYLLICRAREEAQAWSKAIGRQYEHLGQPCFVQLSSLFVPPSFGVKLTLGALLKIVEQNATSENKATLEKELKRFGLPATIVMTAPMSRGGGQVHFAAFVPKLKPEVARRAKRGFPPAKVSQAEVIYANGQIVDRLSLHRADREYLVARGGGDLRLLEKAVTIVGCGAVGSHVATAMAASGVGRITLVDHERLEVDNIHRHVLGAAQVNHPKAEALASHVKSRFPHTEIRSVAMRIQDALDDRRNDVLDAHLLVIALGDETLERRLNEHLQVTLPRIHVWLEPLGIGGHVLTLDPPGAKGCFECLYRTDEAFGLVNMAMLVEPGQHFQRTLAGCSGTFTPFGILDAQRAAIEAVREALSVLVGDVRQPSLVSWVCSFRDVQKGAFRVSPRAISIGEGCSTRVTDFARGDCGACSTLSS